MVFFSKESSSKEEDPSVVFVSYSRDGTFVKLAHRSRRKKPITIRSRNNSSWKFSPKLIFLASALFIACGRRPWLTQVSAFVGTTPTTDATHHSWLFPTMTKTTHSSQQRMRRSFFLPLPPSLDASALHASRGQNNEEKEESSLVNSNRTPQAWLGFLSVAGWPLAASYGIPALVDTARSFPVNSANQIATVTALIVFSRVYLYGVALTIVATAAIRSKNDPNPLGQRLTVLTEELLVPSKPLPVAVPAPRSVPGPSSKTSPNTAPPTTDTINTNINIIEPSFVQKLVNSSGLDETLDGVDAGTQALVLPLLVSGLLAISVVTLPIFTSPSETFVESPLLLSGAAEWIAARLSEWLPLVSQAWNAILLTLFCRAEFRRLGNELLGGILGNDDKEVKAADATIVPTLQIAAEGILAVAVTMYGAYYLQYWPAQNFCNAAIAILVARAIRLDSIRAVALTLSLLVVYDAASVLLVPAASAWDGVAEVASSSSHLVAASAASTNTSPAAASAMGSVAMQKLGGNGFQPGLLVTKLVGTKLTGALGLGDAVFPSILASFLKRFDDDVFRDTDDASSRSTSNDKQPKKSRLFEASLIGYMIGCLACELAPNIATRGVPALVWIVPPMGLATILAAVQQGSFADLLRYNNNDNEAKE